MTVSTIGNGTHIPQWDMYDRMAKALKDAGISIAQAAEYFDVHRNTVSGWLHERINPDTRTLKLWAVMCNVPYEWLKNGTESGPTGGGSPAAPIPGDEGLLSGLNRGPLAYLVPTQPAPMRKVA
jgi:transcriptional regulator with XRE-family HTH domain